MVERYSPERHERDRVEAAKLIADGTVTTWVELGARLGISGQAANQRFGRDGYGLAMPKPSRRYTEAVSASFAPATMARIQELRRLLAVDGSLPSEASVVRTMVERHIDEELRNATDGRAANGRC